MRTSELRSSRNGFVPRTRALERRIVTARENCTMEVLRTRLLKMNGSILKRSRMRPPTLRSFENFSTCTVLFSRTLTFYKYIQLTKPSYSSMLADIETQVVEWVQQPTYPRVGKTSRSYKDILITMLAGNSEQVTSSAPAQDLLIFNEKSQAL